MKEKIVLLPGKHHLAVRPTFYRFDLNLGVGPREARDEIDFVAEAGKEYEFGGMVDGPSCIVWILEKASGKKVVEKRTPDHHKMMISYPVYIPVSQ